MQASLSQLSEQYRAHLASVADCRAELEAAHPPTGWFMSPGRVAPVNPNLIEYDSLFASFAATGSVLGSEYTERETIDGAVGRKNNGARTAGAKLSTQGLQPDGYASVIELCQ